MSSRPSTPVPDPGTSPSSDRPAPDPMFFQADGTFGNAANVPPDNGGLMVRTLFGDAPIAVLTGHYGVGKTNLAINLALAAAQGGFQTTLADLDLVNPYFRSSDYPDVLAAHDVGLLAPTFARTTLDTPALSGRLSMEVEAVVGDPGRRRLVVDVGGDDAGATALGSYRRVLGAAPHRMLHVVNAFRNLTQDPAEAVRVLREVEAACGLACQGVVNNSHLEEQTTWDDVVQGDAWAREVAQCAGLPMVATCVPVHLVNCVDCQIIPDTVVFFVARYATTPWQTPPVC